MVTDTDGRPTTQGTGPAEQAAPSTEQYVSVAELAKAWGRSEYQVREWIKAGLIEGARKVPRSHGHGRAVWEIPARHLPWIRREIPSAGRLGGL